MRGNEAAGSLRIIAGKWRSRKLAFPAQQSLRPTPDRVRETLFNWLQADISGSRCLDLFAGSGALGFEAASRGAAEVVLVEQNSVAASALAQNTELLAADNIEIIVADALTWLTQDPGCEFNLVFLDPPYEAGLLAECSQLLESGHGLAENAKIYIEHAAGDDELAVPDNWVCLKDRRAGQVVYKLFSRR
jgi:16S rRNA (guanine966-N2)-methyltransferase